MATGFDLWRRCTFVASASNPESGNEFVLTRFVRAIVVRRANRFGQCVETPIRYPSLQKTIAIRATVWFRQARNRETSDRNADTELADWPTPDDTAPRQ